MEDGSDPSSETEAPEAAEEPPDDPPPSGPEPVRPDSVIADVLHDRPDARRVLFEEFGLPCYRCEVRYGETIAQGVSYRALDVDAVVARLNRCPPRSAAPA